VKKRCAEEDANTARWL